MNDIPGPLTEKKCSRCYRFSWDNEVGSYKETCLVDDNPCDWTGPVYIEGELQ